MKDERLLPNYKAKFVDKVLTELHEELTQARWKTTELMNEVRLLEQDNAEKESKIQELESNKELLAHTIRDVSVRMQRMEQETKEKCEAEEARTEELKEELRQAVDTYRQAAKEGAENGLCALADYMETLNGLYQAANDIEATLAQYSPTLDLSELNRPYDLQEACEELGLYVPEDEAEPDYAEQEP